MKTLHHLRAVFLSNYFPFDFVSSSDPWSASAADDAFLVKTLREVFAEVLCGSNIDDFLAWAPRTDVLVSSLFTENDHTGWSTAQAFAELMRIPALGAPCNVISAQSDKHFQKTAFARHGIATPKWYTIPPDGTLPEGFDLAYPCIAKWRTGHNSQYIDNQSVVHDCTALTEAIARLTNRGLSVLVEEFIDGTNLTVGAIGPEVCEIGQVVQIDTDDERNLQTFHMKHRDTKMRRKAIFSDVEVVEQANAHVRRIFELFRPFDFMRVDFRYDPDRRALFVVECNIHSNFEAEGSFHMSFATSYPSYRALIARLMQACVQRHGQSTHAG